jgi:hypothetical protein
MLLPDDYDVEIDKTDKRGIYAIRVVNRLTRGQLLFFTMPASPIIRLHERLNEFVKGEDFSNA